MQTFAEGSVFDTFITSLITGVGDAVNSAVTALGGVAPTVALVLGISIGVPLVIRFIRRTVK